MNLSKWKTKFTCAFRGIYLGIEGQSSFLVHLPAALIVPAAAWFLKCDWMEWIVLLFCIGSVLAAELFNSALEWICRGICPEDNPAVGRGLDIASGAVLLLSILAMIIGMMVLGSASLRVLNLP